GGRLLLGSIVPSAALAFFLEFLGGRPKTYRYGRPVALFSPLVGLAVAATPLASEFWARATLSVWVFTALSASVSLLFHRMRPSDSRIERGRLAYLAAGAAASIIFAALDFLEGWGIPFPTLGPVISTLYLFFLAQTLLRLRLMDLHELLGKVASQTALATIL